ncbi:MAG: hypothetical protein ACAH83_17240 [Alphaproteobacteria bacterium]
MLGVMLLLLAGSAAGAEPAGDAGGMDYGFMTYFRHHPPKERMVSRNPYPFAGPAIGPGQDIPVCPAARTEAAYATPDARDMRHIFQGKDGWLFRTSDFRTDFSATPAALRYFDRLNRRLAAAGQTLVVAFQPPRALLAFQHVDASAMPKDYAPEKARKGFQDFLKQLRSAGIAAVDLSAPPAGVSYFVKGDTHWSPEGAMWAADMVAKEAKKIPAYAALPRQKFTTSVAGVAAPSRGAFEEFIQQTCGINIQMTAAPVWTTTAVSPKPKSAPSPGIVLLGTGDSANDRKFGFAGALKASLERDVYNAAVTGGGAGVSPYTYFASDEYRRHPPKIVIWEIPSNYNYNNPAAYAAFRQTLSAIEGGCGDKAALASWSGDIDGNEMNVFSGMEKIPLQNAYLYLEARGSSTASLRTEILYGDGEADEIDMAGSPGASESRRYYLDMNRATAAPAQFLHIVSDRPGGSLVARLCRSHTHVADR